MNSTSALRRIALVVLLGATGVFVRATLIDFGPHERLTAPFGCPSPRPASFDVDVIIDDSGSMAGFLRVGGGHYTEVLQNLLARLSAQHTYDLRRMNDLAEAIPDQSSVYDQTFYAKEHTPLHRAFRRAGSTAESTVTVIITDLEHDFPGTDVRQACASLASTLRHKKHMLLVGFRSGYSQQRDPPCSPGCVAAQQRPVYIIVLASTAELLRAFVDATDVSGITFFGDVAQVTPERKNGPYDFYSSAPPLAMLEPELIDDAVPHRWAPYGTARRVDCGGQGAARPVAAFVATGGGSPPPLKLRWKARHRLSIRDLSRASIEVSATSRPGTSRSTPIVSVEYTGRKQYISSDGSLNYVYRLPVPRPDGWDVYRVFFRPGRANVDLPEWVAQWSTRSSAGSPSTPDLMAIVKTAIDNVTQDEPMLEHFIAVARK